MHSGRSEGKPMTYLTPYLDVRQERGWNHRIQDRWVINASRPLLRHRNNPDFRRVPTFAEAVSGKAPKIGGKMDKIC